MRFARIFFVGLLIGFLPAVSSADENYHMAEVAARADEIFNSSSPAFGNPHGDITIVEFYDYQCGYCRASEEGLEKVFQEDPNLKIIFKDVPKLGALSTTAAIATLASMRQGTDKYIVFHTLLMSKDFHLTSEDAIYQAAASVGLDVDRLKKDMADEAIARQLQDNIALGKYIGANVVPSFVVGRRLYTGVAPYERLKQMIDFERKTREQ